MTRKRILIVEDDAIIGWHMERSLNDLGYRVVGVVDNGEEALGIAAGEPPDLALMDIGLKGKMDGVDTAWLLRHQLNIPVVFLTAYTDPATLERAKHALPYGYLRKPFDDQALRATIEMALHKHILEQQLEESERRYRQLFSTMQEGFALHEIILDELGDPIDYRFLDVNPIFEQMTGLKASEITGKTVLEVMPDTEPHWIETYGQVAKTGLPISFENYAQSLGKYFHVAAFSPSPGQFATLFSDTTETKLLEIDLRRNEKRLRTLTGAASSLIYEIDRNGIIRFANRALPGLEIDELIGSSFLNWYPDSLRPTLQTILERVYSSGVSETTEYSLHDPQGNWHSYLAQFNPVTGGSGIELVVLTATDITIQEQAEMALAEERALLSKRVEERTAALSIANAQLGRAVRTKDEFLASMSHELRTPLTGILGLTEALQKNIYGEPHEKMLPALRNIQESGQHLLSLINDILDLSKIEAGRLELEYRPVSLVAVCESALRLVRQSVSKKAIRITNRYDPQLELVITDERRMKQILVNLLSNAVKFTPESGEIGIETHLDSSMGTMRLTVWDTGIGIDKENIEHLFQPFVQLDSSLSKPYPGTGLGLSLVMKLVEMHGGGIQVDSVPKQGSRFSVILPWRPVGPEDYSSWAQTATRGIVKNADTAPAPRTALVIQGKMSDPLIRLLRERLLEVRVWSPQESPIDLAGSMQPDLIFLDTLASTQIKGEDENNGHSTGYASGWDIISALKASENTSHIPVILVSVLDERLRGISQGAADFLVSPCNPQKLDEVLRKVSLGRINRPVSQESGTKGLAGQTILLAEDNDLTLNTFTDFLISQGCQVVPARNGAEAVELARETRPDTVIMDVQMPVLDGLEAIRKIRAFPNSSRISIIALTALAMVGDRERCLEAGANAYLSKPVGLDQLLQTIQSITSELRAK